MVRRCRLSRRAPRSGPCSIFDTRGFERPHSANIRTHWSRDGCHERDPIRPPVASICFRATGRPNELTIATCWAAPETAPLRRRALGPAAQNSAQARQRVRASARRHTAPCGPAGSCRVAASEPHTPHSIRCVLRSIATAYALIRRRGDAIVNVVSLVRLAGPEPR